MSRRLLTAIVVGVVFTAPARARRAAGAVKPPVAKRIDKTFTIHGETRHDPYFWLRDKDSPEVIAHLEAENAYAKAVLRPTEKLQEALYQEMKGRIVETDLSVPYRLGDFWYYTRTVEGKQYPIHCRKPGNLDAAEQVLLDLNELAKAEKFFALGLFVVSDDGQTLAFTTDVTGFREYTLHVKNLGGGATQAGRAMRVRAVRWAADNDTLFYVTEDDAKRPYRLYRHTLGPEAQHDLIYEEKDELYNLDLTRTRDRAYLIASSESSTTTETRILRSDEPRGNWRLILPRNNDVENYLDHRDGLFYIRTSKDARNFRLVTAPVADPRPEQWTEVLPHRADVMLEDFDLFERHCVVSERADALERLRVINLVKGEQTIVPFEEKLASVRGGQNPEYRTATYRLHLQSLVTPESVYDYDLDTGKLMLRKRTPVRGGYEPENYVSQRIHATAADGVKVPITLLHKKGVKLDGGAPTLLYAYGAYGAPMALRFLSNRLSLVDRGVVFAIAHVRGGGELGRIWHDQGKLHHKKNTFTDFIACADDLVEKGLTVRKRLAIEGGSAGGLTMAAVLNLRPDLCRAAVLHVPFVDVINTMLDPTLPLTVPEYLEWGNPNVKADYDFMKSYCPFTNIGRGPYPAMLVRTSLNDSQVMYFEPAKYVAKMRATRTDDRPLVFTVNMKGGHGGDSGRYDALRETALTYAFILAQLDAGHR